MPNPNTQAYPGLGHFADPNQQATIRMLWDRIHSIEGRPNDTGVTFRASPNLGGHPASGKGGLKITNSADPTDPGDLVTKRYADKTYGGAGLQNALVTGGAATANIIPGTSSSGTGGITSGTHGLRPDASQALAGGIRFYLETDRAAIYESVGGVWTLDATYVDDVAGTGALPSDLGPPDAGFLAFDTHTGITWQWSGAVWHFHQGIMYDIYANRPTAFVGCDAGVIFIATDLGYNAWILDFGTGAWLLLNGFGGPYVNTISNIPAGFLSTDAGFLFKASDFDREYRWTGSAWEDAPGQPTRHMIALFDVAPGTGWALCNGGTVTISTSTGGTASYTTPVINDSRYLKGGAAVSSGGTATPSTGNDAGGGTAVQSGAGTTVAAHPHTHPEVEYPFWTGLPYVRL